MSINSLQDQQPIPEIPETPCSPETNLSEYIKSTYTILNTPNTKTSQTTLESFKQYLPSTLENEEKAIELFNIISSFIFTSQETKKVIKEPFILYPIIYSTSPKLAVNYIDNILTLINSTIVDVNKPLFSFISQILGQIINSLYNGANSSSCNASTNTPLTETEQVSLYDKLLKFCLDNIKLNKKNEQTCGCLYLTELIENCPLVKEGTYLQHLWDTISVYIDDKYFFAKLEILNCLISLIFAAEQMFKPFANVALFKILDYLTDNDWMKRKLSLNVVYTLAFYCHEEIIPLKEYIIEFLNVLKNDKVPEVKEVCLQTLKFLLDDKNNTNEESISNNNQKVNNSTGFKNTSYSASQSAEVSGRDNNNNINNKNSSSQSTRLLKIKKIPNNSSTINTSFKKKGRSTSVTNTIGTSYHNTCSSSSSFQVGKKKLRTTTRGNSGKKGNIVNLGDISNNEHIKGEKERMILEQIQRDIIERRAKTPVMKNNNNNKNTKNSAEKTKISVVKTSSKDKENAAPITHSLVLEDDSNSKLNDTNSNVQLKSESDKDGKITNISGIPSVQYSAVKDKGNEIDKPKTLVKNNLNSKRDINIVDSNTKNEKDDTITKPQRNVKTNKPSNLLKNNITTQKQTTKDNTSLTSFSNLSSLPSKETKHLSISDQLNQLSQTQEIILSTLSSLSDKVTSNYTTLNERISKLESTVSDLLTKRKNPSPTKLKPPSEPLDKTWLKIVNEITSSNYTNALELSLSKDDYLYRCLARIPQKGIRSISVPILEDVLSRLTALIPRGEQSDIILTFCDYVIMEKPKIKVITKHNLKDAIKYFHKNKSKFNLSDEASQRLSKINITVDSLLNN